MTPSPKDAVETATNGERIAGYLILKKDVVLLTGSQHHQDKESYHEGRCTLEEESAF